MSWIKDLQFSLRNLRNQPLFSVAMILTLAVGIGANSAVFSLIDALVLRPFPIPDIDRMVQLYETVPSRGVDRDDVAPANFLDWVEQSESLEELVAYNWLDANLTGSEQPERVQGVEVTPGFLKALGVQPHLGRGLLSSDSDPTQEQTVVLSHQFWQERFGSDPGLIGKTVTLNEVDHVVVGIAAERFDFPYGSVLWVPQVWDADSRQNRQAHYLQVLGRLRPEASAELAQQELSTIATRLADQHPLTNAGRGVNVMELRRAVIDIGAPAFLVVWQATTLFVLLLACVNVANLLMVRGADRQREFSLRLALGAGRHRLVRQLLTENLLVSAGGALLALPSAWLALDVMRNSLPVHIRRFVVGWDQIGLNFRLLAATGLVAVITALIFGLLPSLASSRGNLASILNEAGRGGSEGKGRQTGRTILVTAEVAIALMLLVASGLSIDGTFRMITADQGYNPENLVTMQMQLPPSYSEPERRRNFYDSVLGQVRQLPGVSSVGLSNVLPSSGTGSGRLVIVEGQEAVNESDLPFADFRVVSPDYLSTMEIPLLQGRGLDQRDTSDSQRVALISERMATQLWLDIDPMGRRFRFSSSPADEWFTVVGISGDVIQDWFFGGPRPTVYTPYSQTPRLGAALVVRTAGAPAEIVSATRQAVLRIDPNMPLFDVRTMVELLSDRMIGLRYAAIMMGAFGAIALFLAAIGIYGLMAYSVSRRTREIGVRMALGAGRTDILTLTLNRTLIVMGLGTGVGLMLAWGAGRLMESTLFGTVSLNLSTFAIFTGILLTVAITAALIPARKAMRIDPALALRAE